MPWHAGLTRQSGLVVHSSDNVGMQKMVQKFCEALNKLKIKTALSASCSVFTVFSVVFHVVFLAPSFFDHLHGSTKPFKCILPSLRILVWYSCFNNIIKLSYPILSFMANLRPASMPYFVGLCALTVGLVIGAFSSPWPTAGCVPSCLPLLSHL